MKKTITRVLGVGTLALVLAAGCANTEDDGGGAPDEDGPITIGILDPFSGPLGPDGKRALEAVQIQVDALNEAGGVLGRQVEVVSRDDKSTPGDAVAAANDLVNEGIDVIIGGFNSPVTLAVQPVFVKADVLNITALSQNTSILGGADPAGIGMNLGSNVGGFVAAEFFKEQGYKRVALITQDDAYGEDSATVFKNYLGDAAEVVEHQKFAFTDNDFRIPLSNVQGSDPDAVFSANASESSGQPALLKQYAQSKIDVPLFSALGTVTQHIVELAGDGNTDGVYSGDMYFPDVEPFTGFEANNEFVEKFEERAGQLPDKYAFTHAQAVIVWAEAVERAGTTDRTAVADEIQGGTFENTLIGDVSFSETGQHKAPVYVFTVKNNMIEIVESIDIPDRVWDGK